MLQSIVLSCYPFHILLLVRIVANHGWTLQQGSIPAAKRNLFFFSFLFSFLFSVFLSSSCLLLFFFFALLALGLTWDGCFNCRWKSHPS